MATDWHIKHNLSVQRRLVELILNPKHRLCENAWLQLRLTKSPVADYIASVVDYVTWFTVLTIFCNLLSPVFYYILCLLSHVVYYLLCFTIVCSLLSPVSYYLLCFTISCGLLSPVVYYLLWFTIFCSLLSPVTYYLL